nr:hypothetical protein [Candidatus Sigynarchaeum springense]
MARYFFYTSLVVNVSVYFLCSMAAVMQVDNVLNDFYITFRPGVEKILKDPDDLYDPIAGICSGMFCNAYRNLPALTLYHLLFYQLGTDYHLDLFLCSLFIVYFNLASCWLVFKIARHEKMQALSTNKAFFSPYFIAGTYLIVMWHYHEYFHGHTQAITGFFALLGFYFLLEEKEHLGFMSWSIAAIFKLNILLWIVFLIWRRPFSRFFKNVGYSLIPQVPNIVMFLRWPKMAIDFIPSNIAFSLVNAVTFYRVSGTFSRELSYLFGVPITGFAVAMLACFVPTTFFILYRRKLHHVDRLFLVILATIAILPDFWTAHALYVLIPYLFWLSVRSPGIGLKMKLVCATPLFFSTPWFFLVGLSYSIPLRIPLISLCFFIPFLAMTVHSIREPRVR